MFSRSNLWLLCMNVNYGNTEVIQALSIVGGGNFKSVISMELWVYDDPDDTKKHSHKHRPLIHTDSQTTRMHFISAPKASGPVREPGIFKTARHVTPRPSTYICGIILHNIWNYQPYFSLSYFHSTDGNKCVSSRQAAWCVLLFCSLVYSFCSVLLLLLGKPKQDIIKLLMHTSIKYVQSNMQVEQIKFQTRL